MRVSRAIQLTVLSLLVSSIVGCHNDLPSHPDHPYIASGVAMHDVTFHSPALNRYMPYRVFLPLHIHPNQRLPVVYLLHGGNGSFRDWSNDSQVSNYAACGIILVMPEGEFSYYMNAAEKAEDKYEGLYLYRSHIGRRSSISPPRIRLTSVRSSEFPWADLQQSRSR